jgi:peptidoglycan/LPS O-acetylase OafA/YrhL
MRRIGLRKHKNNIGLVRLVLASAVIVGHAAPQVDGNALREPFLRIFGTLALGEIAVAGFFLISGYLITMSMVRSPSIRDYLTRRVLRIWPGYFAAALICSFVLAPVVGGRPAESSWQAWAGMVLLLGPLDTAGQLRGIPIPVLNGSMWTIWLEFVCYLGVAVLGLFGLLRRFQFIAGLSVGVGAVAIIVTIGSVRQTIGGLGHAGAWFFVVGPPLHLAVFFLAGMMGYLQRDTLHSYVDGKIAGISMSLWLASLLSSHTAVVGSAVFGGIAIYWLSFKANLGRFQGINDRWDISYGTYLYGWPIATALLYFNRSLQPWELATLSMPVAWAMGGASWWLLEQPTKDLFANVDQSRDRHEESGVSG